MTTDNHRGHGRNVSEDYLADRAKFIRLETLRLARIAGAGHYSSTFSAAELFSALYYAHLRIDPGNPKWPDRDRFILSKGHAAIGLYPILADLGFGGRDARDHDRRGAQCHRRPWQRGRRSACGRAAGPLPAPRHPGRILADRSAGCVVRSLRAGRRRRGWRTSF